MTAKLDLAVSPLKTRSVSDTCVPSIWRNLSALIRGVEPKSDDEQICRKKGRNGTTHSGTDIINEQLCFFVQVLLLISC